MSNDDRMASRLLSLAGNSFAGDKPGHESLTARATMKRDDFGLGRGTIVQAVADKMSTVEIALVAVRKAVKTPEARELPAHEASTFGGKT